MSNTLKQLIDKEFVFEPYDFEQTEIDGIPLYTKHFSFAPCIHIRIRFNYGAIHDEPGKEGIAHFLEHMLFKGNNLYPTEQLIDDFGKDILLNTHNAHTGLFELVIKGKCLPHNFEKAIEGLFSQIHSSFLTQESYEQEMKVIVQEAWRKVLNQKFINHIKHTRKIRLANVPDRIRFFSALGWPDTITNITHEDIVKASKKFLVKENMEIILAGNMNVLGDSSAYETILKNAISKIPKGEKAPLPYVPETIDLPTQPILDVTYSEIGLTEKNQTELGIGYNFARTLKKAGAPIIKEEGFFLSTCILAARLVGDIVYEKLRTEHSWCYSAGASMEINPDFYVFRIDSNLNSDHVEEAIEIIDTILKDIANGQYKEKFEQRKKLLVEATLAGENTTAHIIDSLIDDIEVHNRVIKEREALETFTEVEFTDVQHMISTHLTQERKFTIIVRPSSK